jgi:hypothetical protein
MVEETIETNYESSVKKLQSYRDNHRQGFFKRFVFGDRTYSNFARENPDDAEILVSKYGEVAGPVERATTFKNSSKLKKVLEEEENKQYTPFRRFLRKHPFVWKAPVMAQIFLSAMSPTKPLMVTPYLASQAVDRAYSFVMPDVSARAENERSELEDFLTTREQIVRYRKDLLKDFADFSSEYRFVIAKDKNGNLSQEKIRTLHEGLADYLPAVASEILDRKAIPRLDDYVRLWQKGSKVVAEGHYHAAGEGPSDEDLRVAKQNPDKNQIVVTNGFIPLVFLNGGVLQYQSPFEVDFESYASTDNLRYSLRNVIIPSEELNRLLDFNSLSKREDFLSSFLKGISKYYSIEVENPFKVKLLLRNEVPKVIDRYKSFNLKCPYNFERVNDLYKSFDALIGWSNDEPMKLSNSHLNTLTKEEFERELSRMVNLKDSYSEFCQERKVVEMSINLLQNYWESQNNFENNNFQNTSEQQTPQ